MSVTDLLPLFSKYGAAGIIIAFLLAAVIYLYKQQQKNLTAANARADRYEAEVKQLNNDIQMFLALDLRAKRVMSEATTEMRMLNADSNPGQRG